MEMKIILMYLVFLFVCLRAEEKCKKVVPCKNLDWTKLTGSWYHVMFVSGEKYFLNCRMMRIAKVNQETKIIDVEFHDVVSYNRSPRIARHEFFYFGWTDEPAKINTGIKSTYSPQKFSKKFLSKRKSSVKNLYGLKSSSFTMVSTNYKDYAILVQCHKGGVPSAWISLKSWDVDYKLAETIRNELTTFGFDATSLSFNNSNTCKP